MSVCGDLHAVADSLGAIFYKVFRPSTITSADQVGNYQLMIEGCSIRATVRMTTAPEEATTIFWRVDFLCNRVSCHSHIVVHTRTESGLTHGAIARRIADAIPQPTCVAGHPLGKLHLLDEVEWLGEDGHLT